MAKFCGKVGYFVSKEVRPGVYKNEVVEKVYCGDVSRNSRRLQSTNTLNDNIVVSNEISIVADPFANENFHHIIYVEFMGTKWKVSNVEVQYPRLILSIGEVYTNGDT